MFGDDLSGDFLALRARTTPERTALRDSDAGDSWTARDLDAAAEEAAATLAAHAPAVSASTAASPRVGVAVSTRPAYVVALYGAIRLGWTVVPLNVRLAAGELATRLDRVEPDVVVCESDTADLLGGALQQAESDPDPVLSVDDPGPALADGVVPAADAGEVPAAASPTGLDETALIMFTSGTTGEPKGVRLTPRNLLASAVASAFRLGVSPDDRWLCCLPMYHMGGLAPAFRSAIYGTELVIQRAFDAAETARLLAEAAITGVSLVPTQLKRLLDETDDCLPAPALGTVLLGGAPASAELLDRAAAADVPVFPTYGLTETASQVATARPEAIGDHPETVGQPLLGTRVRILPREADNGDPLPAGERGEVVVDGPTVTPGYLDAERTAAAFGPCGLHTGDLGWRDEDGRLWIEGRIDDVIVTGGELVAPATVAEAVAEVAGVEAAAVVGLDDEEWGERVGALVVPGEDAPADERLRAAIAEHCRETLADYERPKTVAVATELPRTHSGTVDRDAVADTLRARRSPPDTD